MDWSTITRAEILAAVSAAVALLSASYTWRNYRISARKEKREIEATKPIVETSPWRESSQAAPWGSVTLTVRNRYPHAIHVVSVRLLSPSEGKLGYIRVDPNRPVRSVNMVAVYDYEAVEHESQWFRPKNSVIGHVASSNSSNTIEFALYPTELERVYSLELVWEERLEETRRSTKIVKIKVPALKPSAMIATQSALDN